MAESANKPYIFISYAHKDIGQVKSIMERMEKEGYRIWYDDGIDPGTEWDENIAAHIKKCAYFIAFVSSNYMASKNCKDELNYARDLDKKQLLVYLEEVKLPDGMAMRMNRLQAIWWCRYENKEKAYEKLFLAKGIHVAGSGTYADEDTEFEDDFAYDRNPSHAPMDGAGRTDTDKRKKGRMLGCGLFVLLALICLLFFFLFRKSGEQTSDAPKETEAYREETTSVESYMDADKMRTTLQWRNREVPVFYPDCILDFQIKDESLCYGVTEVAAGDGEIVFTLKVLHNEWSRKTATIGLCLYFENNCSKRELLTGSLEKGTEGETILLRLPVSDEWADLLQGIRLYEMAGEDMLYSQVVDGGMVGSTLHILQDYASGSTEDPHIRMTLGGFRAERCGDNPDYMDLYVSAGCCQNDNGASVWVGSLECFDENGQLLLPDGEAMRLEIKCEDGRAMVEKPYESPVYLPAGEKIKVRIPVQTRTVNICAYDLSGQADAQKKKGE